MQCVIQDFGWHAICLFLGIKFKCTAIACSTFCESVSCYASWAAGFKYEQPLAAIMGVSVQLTELNLERNKMTKEKVNLENQLEAEQEYILNKLHKQVRMLS